MTLLLDISQSYFSHLRWWWFHCILSETTSTVEIFPCPLESAWRCSDGILHAGLSSALPALELHSKQLRCQHLPAPSPVEPCWQWQPFPENSGLSDGLFPATGVEMQVGHSPSSSLLFSCTITTLRHTCWSVATTSICAYRQGRRKYVDVGSNLNPSLPPASTPAVNERISPVPCKSWIVDYGSLPAVVQQWGTHLLLNFKTHFILKCLARIQSSSLVIKMYPREHTGN